MPPSSVHRFSFSVGRAAGSLFLAASLTVGLTACGGSGGGSGADGGGGGPDAGVSPACMEATQHSDLAWIQDNVLTGSCALSASCHQGGAQAALGLNLESGMTEANTVGVVAKEPKANGLNIVEPGDPQNSYMMIILGQYGADDPRLPAVGTMPYNSPMLCQEKRDAIQRWIEGL